MDPQARAVAATAFWPSVHRGTVTEGDRRGRQLGFPTANAALESDTLTLADGVYAGIYIRPTGALYACAISLGRRPTFYEVNGLRLLEAHLLDFSDDLYGEACTVVTLRWVRPQQRFESAGELAAQLRRDIAEVRRCFQALGGASNTGIAYGGSASLEPSAATKVLP